MSRYDTWLQPRERAGFFEVSCGDCGETFESVGTSIEGSGCELRVEECPECGSGDLTVTGDAEPPEPDYDAYREAQLEDRYDR